MDETDALESSANADGNRKRKKYFGDERLHRNRERNRMHARKTRERKKQQSNAMQTRLNELEDEGKKLRQIVDERYTASVLLGLSQTFRNSLGENLDIQSSANICSGASLSAENHAANSAGRNFQRCPPGTQSGSDSNPQDDSEAKNINNSNSVPGATIKRVRRRGKYTPQERERIRRERNRMHAKRTRDRKKKILEDSETIICRLERESHLLRGYCVSLNMLSMEDATRFEERASESKRELAALKASQGEYDVDCDEDDYNEFDHNDDDGDGDDEHDNDGSLSGSDDNEKSCSWNGSNNGNESMDSLNGDTSGDASSSASSSSKHGSSNSGDNASSGSGSSHSLSHNSSGSGSGSGGDSPLPKHAKSDWKAEKGFNYGIKPPSTYSNKPTHPNGAYPSHAHAHVHVHVRPSNSHASLSLSNPYSSSHMHPTAATDPRCDLASSSSSQSQSVESYNHGCVTATNVYNLFAVSNDLPPTPSFDATSIGDIKTTLAAVDYFKNDQNTAAPQPRIIRPNPVQPDTSSFSTRTGTPYSKKVKNILLAVIPGGISAPRGAGGVSPQGSFTPIPNILNSQVTIKWRPAGDQNELNVYSPRSELEYRNLPSSNTLNSPGPL